MSVICARLGSKGKVGVQRGRKTAGCPSFLPTAVGTASSPLRGAARSRRPQTANPPLRFSGKLPARQGRTRLRQFECPAGSVQKRSRPERANTLTQFVCPGFPVLKKLPPRSGEPACAVRVSRLTLRSYLTILRRQSMLSQQQNRRKYEPVHPCALRPVPRH